MNIFIGISYIFVTFEKKTTMSSPYNGLNVEDWKSKTEELIKAHPLKKKSYLSFLRHGMIFLILKWGLSK